MKGLFLFLILFFVIENSLNAQWEEQESGTDKYLYSTYFLDEENGWIIGANQTILKTVNAGDDWIDISPTTPMLTVHFNCIWFTDQNTGYIGCYLYSSGFTSRDPYCLKTFNGGTTWEYETSVVLQSGSYPGISDVFFIDDMRGWMVRGARVYKTFSGISGTFFNITYLSEFLKSIHFINQNVGWVAGNNGLIAKTLDGGQSWDELSTGITDNLKSVYFVNQSVGWAVGYNEDNGLIIKSTDGGQTWYNTNLPSTKTLREIYFINENIGWACGSITSTPSDKGVILYTDNGGDTWKIQHIENNCTVFPDIDFVNNTTGWAAGSNGIIVKTTNAGGTAFEVNEDSSFNFSLNIHPNPFTSSITIKYELKQPSTLQISIFNHLGKLVHQAQENQSLGKQQLIWNAEGFADGIYYYKLQVGEHVASGKLVKAKG